jgi:TRAP-type C4-dicarboxylate transport system permease small subunit
MAPEASTTETGRTMAGRRLLAATVRRASQRLLHGLRMAVAALVVLLFAYMTVAVLAQVIGRYVFNFSIASAAETATFAQIWMVMLGAGYAMRRGLHVSVDIVVNRLPLGVVRLLNVVITALCLWFLWVLFEGSLRLIEVGRDQTSAALQIPMLYPYLVIPAGAAYFALEFVLTMWTKCVERPGGHGADREQPGL